MKLTKINKKKRLVALLLISVVAVACVHLYNRYQHANQPDYWLSIPLHDSIVLYHYGSNKTAVSIIDFERVLDKACKDPKCQGVIIDLKLRFSTIGVAITDAQAIGNAMKNFQQTSNKKVIACTHGHTAEKATTPYDALIASYANEWHHEAGASIRIEEPYQKKEQKQSTKVQIAHNLYVPISEIKAAGVAVYETRKEGKEKCSPEQNEKLLSQQQEWLRKEVIKNRGKKLTQPFMLCLDLIKPEQAEKINLIDQLVEGKPSSQRNMYPYAKYKRLLPRNNNPWWPSAKVLIIDISGRIEGSFEQDEAKLMSSSLERLLNSMEKYDMVILLLNTEGGGVLAAEYMREKIKHASHKNIPVIAIERNGCFSSGVWVASCCDKVLAYRSTGTGSIGIIVSHPTLDFTALFKKLNINAQDSVAEAFEKVKKKKDLLEDATVGECFKALRFSRDNIIGADYDAFIRIFGFSSLTIEKLLAKPIKPIIEANKDMQITTFIRNQPYFCCFFSEKERKVNQKTLNDAYKKFLDTVVEKNKQDPTKFDEAYGQGKLYLANKGFITDEFIEDTLLNTFKKLAEQENLKSPSYTWARA